MVSEALQHISSKQKETKRKVSSVQRRPGRSPKGCKPLGAPRISFKTIAARMLEGDLSRDLKSMAGDVAGPVAEEMPVTATGDVVAIS